jgi:Ca2+-binding RTX toxin-like protein
MGLGSSSGDHLRTSARPSGGSFVESLEERRLMAAERDVVLGTVKLEGGKLDIEGTRKADAIVVALNTTTGAIDVTMNGVLKGSFTPNQIAFGIEIESRQGNDSVTIDPAITIGVDCDGATGNDTITGGSGDDDIKGGPGKDQIFGNAGNDNLEGESGKDSLSGGAGIDAVDGGSGRDLCSGGDGNDLVVGGSGNDDLSGDVGDDRIRGGPGVDDCNGGDGNDDIDGGSGRDRVTGGPGTDDFNELSNTNRRGKGGDLIADKEPGEDDAGDNLGVDQVPAIVTAAFNNKYPGATVREVELEQEDSGPHYKFDFFTGKQEKRAWFTEAGQFINEELRS